MLKSLRAFGLYGKFVFVFGIWLVGSYFLQTKLPTSLVGISSYTVYAATSATVETWWPIQGAVLDGVHPFKALVKDKPLGEYRMFWQVDGGQYVKMDDNYTDYPHKEALVDFSGWNWSATGSYTISFIAQDLTGRELAKTSMLIKHGVSSSAVTPSINTSAVTTQSSTSVSLPTSTTVSSTSNVSSTNITVIENTSQVINASINALSPIDGSIVSGTQPARASIQGLSLSSYRMYWSVDGGNLVNMQDVYTDGERKEYYIDYTNWNWKGIGPYAITFTAKDLNGKVMAQKTISIYTGTAAKTTTTTSVTAPITTTATTAIAPATETKTKIAANVATSTTTQLPLSGSLYVDPNNPALGQAIKWLRSRPADSAIMQKIGSQSTGIWLGGWNADVQNEVAATMKKATAQNQTPTFIVYNIPGRDCGSYSAGGLSSKSAYLSWIQKVSAGLGTGSAIVVLEPDAIAGIDCLSSTGQEERFAMISSAIDIFKTNNVGTKVYVDAGHPNWVNIETMSARLAKAGISKAAGFSINVSNFITTSENISYGDRLSNATNGAHYIVDTSRNGSGSNGEWCNPSGRSLGQRPTLDTANSKIDALLWLKKPGESDGNCNGGPNAGEWWPEYALDLAKRAGY